MGRQRACLGIPCRPRLVGRGPRATRCSVTRSTTFRSARCRTGSRSGRWVTRDAPRVWDALVDGFRDHRHKPESTDEDRERFLDNPVHDPSLWVIAFDGDEIAGGVVNIVDPEENAQTGNRRGYVEAVFTRPAWRRRGLARALVAESLVRLRDRGMTSALLGVDGANPNQAMTLYEDIGFEIAATELEWRRPLTAGEDPR